MVSLITGIVGLILFVIYIKRNISIIDKTDPENSQKVMDLKQLLLKHNR